MLAVTLPKTPVAQNRRIGNRNTFSFACLLQRKEEKVAKEGIEVERGKKVDGLEDLLGPSVPGTLYGENEGPGAGTG